MSSAIQRLLEATQNRSKVIFIKDDHLYVKLLKYETTFNNLKNAGNLLLEHEQKSLENLTFKMFIEMVLPTMNVLNEDSYLAVDSLIRVSNELCLSDDITQNLKVGLIEIANLMLISFKEYQDDKDFRDYKFQWFNSGRLRFVSTDSNL